MAMRTFFQDFEGSIPDLEGCALETFLCVQVKDDESNSLSPGVFWLKLQDGTWYRFFIDPEVYYLSWTAQEQLDESDLNDEDDFPVLNLTEQFGRYKHKIEMKQMERNFERQGCLTVTFADGKIFELTCGSKGSRLSVTQLPREKVSKLK